MANSTVLITGGAGFIGSTLALALKSRHPDWRVVALDNLTRRGSELNRSRLIEGGVHFVHGDVRIPSDLELEAFAIDTVIDCSAEPSVLAGYSSPAPMIATNLTGTANVLELARRRRARLLFLSTSRIYPIEGLRALAFTDGSTRFQLAEAQPMPGASALGVSEDFPLAGHRSLYGATKLASEMLAQEYHHAFGMPLVIDRCGVVTGPWQMARTDQGVFALWVAAHRFGRPLTYEGFGGSGHQVRDLIHVDDLVDLVDLQLARFSGLDGGVFNVGGGPERALSLVETTALCREITGREIAIRPVEVERPGDVPVYVSDCRKLERATGWRPRRDARTTLEDIHRWIAGHEDLLARVLVEPKEPPCRPS